jgi:hypothetical protein
MRNQVTSTVSECCWTTFTWDSGVIEVNHDYEIVFILKLSGYGDFNNTPVLYLRSNLGSNFFVQTNTGDIKTESETIPNINSFMQILMCFFLFCMLVEIIKMTTIRQL